MSTVFVEQGPIVPTEAAIVQASMLAKQQETPVVMVIGARPGGCSGLSWEMYFTEASEVEENSEVCEYKAGEHSIAVAVDAGTAKLARGSTLEFSQGLTQGGFKITNPNATRSCGCGQSFS